MRDELVPDAGRIFSWIEELYSLGVRRPGSEVDARAEEWCRERFVELRLDDVRFEDVPLLAWGPRSWSLHVNGEELPCFPLPYSEPGVVEAELADLEDSSGRIAAEHLELNRIPMTIEAGMANRVVDPDGEFDELVHTVPFGPRIQEVLEPAIEAGAAGYVGMLTGVPWDTCEYYVPYDAVPRPIPGVWVSASTARRIDELRARGPVTARIEVDAVREERTTRNVLGTLPGATDEWVVVGCHHDGPWASAVEDAGGVGLVLAQAAYWLQVPVAERPHNMLFLLGCGHMAEGAGTQAFLRDHADLLDDIVLEVHLEHPAVECEYTGGELVPTDRPDVRWWFTSENPRLEDAVADALTAEDLRRSVVLPPEAFFERPPTDGGFFHTRGVPLVNYLVAVSYLFDARDTLDKIHRPSLEAVTRAAVRILEATADETAASMRDGVVADR